MTKPPGSIRPIVPTERATGHQGQDLGFRGYQPRLGAGLDPSSYGPNKPLFIPQNLQDAYRPDESQDFRAYEGPLAGLATMLGLNPGNPAPGSWDYVGDPNQGFRATEGPGAGLASDLGLNPGKAAPGAWDSGRVYAKGGAGKKGQGGAVDIMSLLRQLSQRVGGKGGR